MRVTFLTRRVPAGRAALGAYAGLLIVLGAPVPAWSLGGSAAGTPRAVVESGTVMVLSSRGNMCTGTVLSPRIILTAGHCVAGAQAHAIAYRENGSPILQAVQSTRLHPGFSRNAKVSVDMALIRLKEPLPQRFSAVPLDDGAVVSDIGGDRLIAGFGLVSHGEEKSAGFLRSASVTILPRHYPRFMRLGVEAGTLSICKGDSGGPVLDNSGDRPRLVAVLYGAEQAGGSRCGVNAQAVRVAPQVRWIRSVSSTWGERL
jgi:S1-C subfamily serine protease